jgi:serine/threonine-protein kinase
MSSLNDFVTERAATRVGAVLRGKWKLERVLGVGGMATVYAATHRNQSRVAIKVLHPEVSLDADVTARFLREGYVANVIDHSGTVKVLDDDVTEDGAPFLVMELLEGETVDARWERKLQRLPISEVSAIGDQILDVLAAAHDKGVVHRDLKPENLFLTRNGELRVLDFGIARLREVSSETSTQTRAGSLLGTPAFMAPEQARGRWEEVDARTDIWAVGATLFTLIAGRFVHESDTVQEQLIRAATVAAPSLATLAPEVSPALVAIIDRALAFDKTERWPDARSMQAALRAATAGEDRDAPLTLPVPSLPANNIGETETITVPRHPLPTNPTYSTARPVTHAVASSVATQRSWKPFYAVAAAALVALVGVAGILVYNRSHTPVAPTTDQPVQAARPAPTAVDTTVPTVTVVTTQKAPAPATPEPSAKPAVVEKPVVTKTGTGQKPVVKKNPDGETKTEALVPTTKPAGNPFDRRF